MAMPRVQTTTAGDRSLPEAASHPSVSVDGVGGIASKKPAPAESEAPRLPRLSDCPSGTPSGPAAGPARPGMRLPASGVVRPCRRRVFSTDSRPRSAAGVTRVLTVPGPLQILLAVRGKPTADDESDGLIGSVDQKGVSALPHVSGIRCLIGGLGGKSGRFGPGETGEWRAWPRANAACRDRVCGATIMVGVSAHPTLVNVVRSSATG